MTSQILSFAGVPTPAFLIIEKIQFSVLPASDIKQLDIPMKNGSYFVNKRHGVRMFTAEFVIKSDSKNGVMYDSDTLATWLFHQSPQPIIFRDKPNISYNVIVDNSVDISTFANSGRGQISFLALDPYGIGQEKNYQFMPTDEAPFGFINEGNAITYPKIEVEFSQDTTELAIVANNDEMLYFGNPVQIDTQVAVDSNPIIFNEDFSTMSGWSNQSNHSRWKCKWCWIR